MATTFEDIRKAAADGKGVTLIPFEDLRTKATNASSDVERCKAKATSWNYVTYEKQKDNLLKDKKTKETEIEAKKKEIEDLKQRFKEVSADPLEKDQKKLEEQLKEIEDDIKEMNKEFEQAAEDWKNFADARAAIRKIFDEVRKEIDRAESRPQDYLGDSPSDNDKEIFKKSFEVIDGEIEDEEEEHQKQEDGARGTEQKFRELIKKTAV